MIQLRSVLIMALIVTAPTNAAEPSIKDLDRLIGTWRYDDRSAPALGFDYRETGTRTCAYGLADTYIRCISEGVANGKSHVYEFNFNYNAIDERFEMVAIFSHYGPKMFYVVTLREGGRRVDLLAPRMPRNGQTYTDQSWATITFDGNDRMIWTTRRNRSTQHPDEWPTITVDDAHRILVEQ